MKYTDYFNLKEKKAHGDFEILMDTYENTLDMTDDAYLHWHDEMELIYIFSGNGEIHIDLNSYMISKGDLIIIKKGSLHYMNNTSGNPLKYEAIVFNLDMFTSSTIDFCSSNFINPLINNSISMNPIIKPIINNLNSSNYESLIDYFQTISTTFKKKDFAYQLKIKGFFFLLFSEFFNEGIIKISEKNLTSADDKLRKLKDVLDYININYNKPISINDLARISEYSEYHFLRFFKKQTGRTCTQFINAIRINKALKLLLNTNLPITNIALDVGFSDVSYFIKVFKRHTSLSPSVYRKQYVLYKKDI